MTLFYLCFLAWCCFESLSLCFEGILFELYFVFVINVKWILDSNNNINFLVEKKCDETLCSFWQISLAFLFIIIQCYFLLYRHSSWCLMFSGVTMMLLNSFWTQWREIMVKNSDVQEWPMTYNKPSKWNSCVLFYSVIQFSNAEST